jgi:hypothetical protein
VLLDEYEDLPLTVVALCMDNSDRLDTLFKDSERPPFAMGYVDWSVEEQTQTRGVPQYLLLDEDRTLLFHTESLRKDEEGLREVLTSLTDEDG